MYDFLKFFDQKSSDYPMHLEIYYSKTLDWSIYVYKKGCTIMGNDLIIVSVQNGDMELCFAEAHVKLKEWLLDNEGGY